jgi:hypothetical protein
MKIYFLTRPLFVPPQFRRRVRLLNSSLPGAESGGYPALMAEVSRPLRERLIEFEDVETDRARGRAQRETAPRLSLA